MISLSFIFKKVKIHTKSVNIFKRFADHVVLTSMIHNVAHRIIIYPIIFI